MRNLVSLRKYLFHKPVSWLILLLLSFGVTLSQKTPLVAQTTNPVPSNLQVLINQIETAANEHDLKKIMEFYSPEFTNSDGLSYTALQQTLTELWQKYKNIQYNTLVESWSQEGDTIIVETVTKIQATGDSLGRTVNLTSTITSKQHFKDQKLVYQEILAEKTEMKSGNNPPQIEIRLPQKVKVGQTFDFDVIVEQPLGEDRLAGAALNEKIASDRFLNPSTLNLELLPAGGIFKRVAGIGTAENQWFSAIVVWGDGMTIVTQRVNVQQ